MAGRRNYGARVRRYSSHQRVLTEVQPKYDPPSAATAQMWGMVKSGLEDGVKFLRPAVEQEQTVRGEREALEAYETGSFEMRNPLTIRNQAFNTTGERLITNRAMQRFEEGLRDVQTRSGSVQQLETNIAEFQAQFFGEMPDIPGLRTRFVSQFERAEATMRRAAVNRASRAAAAQHRAAAREAVDLVESEVERTALTTGTETEVAAVVTEGAELVASYGPREAFTAGGVQFPPDPNRSGVLRESQVEDTIRGMRETAEETFLRAQILQTESPMQLAQEFQEEVFSGQSDLPADQALRLLGSLQSQARTRENQRLQAERDAERALAEAAEEALNPYVIAGENGIPIAIPEAERAAILEGVSGNPTLRATVERELAVADAIVDLGSLDRAGQISYIEDLFAQFEATPGVSADEARLIQELAPRLTALRGALDEEQIGVPAAEQAINSGMLLDEETLANMRVQAAGVPELEQAVDQIEAAQEIITNGEPLTGVQREEQMNAMEDALMALSVRGGRVGAAAVRQLDALEGAREYWDAQAETAASDATRFAARNGIELEPFPSGEDASIADVGAVITARVTQLQPHTSRVGVNYPVPISASEREVISDIFQGANNATRVAFLQGFSDLPRGQREAIFNALGQDNPQILAASRVSTTAPNASRAILAGVGANIGRPATVVQQVEQQQLAPITMAGILPPQELEAIRDTALAYATGMAVREGLSEISPAHLEDGYNLALGADDEGNGGLEEIRTPGMIRGRSFGVTILPTGVTGEQVGEMLQALTPERILEIAGGPIEDAYGNAFNPDRLLNNVAGFRPVSEGVFAPFDANGGYFAVPSSEAGILLFNLEDLQ